MATATYHSLLPTRGLLVPTTQYYLPCGLCFLALSTTTYQAATGTFHSLLPTRRPLLPTTHYYLAGGHCYLPPITTYQVATATYQTSVERSSARERKNAKIFDLASPEECSRSLCVCGHAEEESVVVVPLFFEF
jgi:hypothetical protein